MSFSVHVDVRNPGQFFACCGLFELASRAEPPAAAWWSPIETVSNSEGGFERVYQGSALVFTWPLHLAPGGARTFRIRHEVSTSRDRAAEEGL